MLASTLRSKLVLMLVLMNAMPVLAMPSTQDALRHAQAELSRRDSAIRAKHQAVVKDAMESFGGRFRGTDLKILEIGDAHAGPQVIGEGRSVEEKHFLAVARYAASFSGGGFTATAVAFAITCKEFRDEPTNGKAASGAAESDLSCETGPLVELPSLATL